MGKIRIDRFIFGYRMVKIDNSDVNSAVGLLLKNGIPSTMFDYGILIIRERDVEKLRRALEGLIKFELSPTLGLYGKLIGIKNKVTVCIAILIIIILSILSENVIWDVRIEGNETICDTEIILKLQSCGLSVGEFWSNIDRSLIETKVLSEYPEISWININRRGSVAYVDLREKEGIEKVEQNSKYVNIVASEDCIIEEITVKSGVATVKVGDVVKKGDLLISGVLPYEMGGGFCVANGEIKGRVADKVEVFIGRSELTKKVKNTKIARITLNFFDFNINIFKKYGNSDNGCDIIEKKETFTLFGNKKLPFSITKVYNREYEYCKRFYSDDEITSLAARRMNSQLFSRLINADLIKIKTFGSFTDSGYKTYSNFIFCCDVGHALEYKIE